jgi:hypothetical protein
MKKFSFQIGSAYAASPQVDPWFETALASVRNALSGPAPMMSPTRKVRRLPTRFEARIRTLSN